MRRLPYQAEASLLMGYIQGEGRNQGTLFPVVLDAFVPADHACRVIDAFVGKLVMSELGFERAQAAETGRPGYDPRDLLKLYLYGYLNQIRSSRRLQAECRRNVELMWLLGRLYPDHKSIAEFRRMHRDTVTASGAELLRFADKERQASLDPGAVQTALEKRKMHSEPEAGLCWFINPLCRRNTSR